MRRRPSAGMGRRGAGALGRTRSRRGRAGCPGGAVLAWPWPRDGRSRGWLYAATVVAAPERVSLFRAGGPGRRRRSENVDRRRPHALSTREAPVWPPRGGRARLISSTSAAEQLEILHAADALAQELILHGQFRDDSLLPPALLVEVGHWPDFERLSASGQQGVAHSVRVAAATPCLRLVDSRSAPRSSSSTMLVLRLADHRPLPPRPISASRSGRPPGR